MKRDCKIRSGYRVVGHNTSNGALHSWYMGSLEDAKEFAEQLSATTGQEVDVCKYIGSYRPKEAPTEFVPASDVPPPALGARRNRPKGGVPAPRGTGAKRSAKGTGASRATPKKK